jgi:hypothetical protein
VITDPAWLNLINQSYLSAFVDEPCLTDDIGGDVFELKTNTARTM